MRPPVSRSSLLAPLAALALWLVAPGAGAWPVDLAVRLEPGKERFHKLSVVEWVEVEDPTLATAEVLTGSNELLLTGLKPGHTLLLLYAEGRFAVWGLTVAPAGTPDAPPPEALVTAARKACPGLQATQGAERSLTAEVKDSRCRQALLGLLKTEAYLARELDLTLELPVLQEQLSALTPALKAVGVRASYHGAGLMLEGSTSPEGHRQALWALFRESAGRVPLEDRVEVRRPPPPDDAGTPGPRPTP
jgi:hypothetical protein